MLSQINGDWQSYFSNFGIFKDTSAGWQCFVNSEAQPKKRWQNCVEVVSYQRFVHKFWGAWLKKTKIWNPSNGVEKNRKSLKGKRWKTKFIAIKISLNISTHYKLIETWLRMAWPYIKLNVYSEINSTQCLFIWMEMFGSWRNTRYKRAIVLLHSSKAVIIIGNVLHSPHER